MNKRVVAALLDGAPGTQGFHYWQGGAVAHRARPGVRGLVRGFRDAQAQGIDLYEVVQGEHLFRHVLQELSHLAGAEGLVEDVWRIRSETVSPREKARALLRHLEQFVQRGEARLARTGRAPAGRRPPSAADVLPAPAPGRSSHAAAAVGRDRSDQPTNEEERGGARED
jgi:hypothetical protein